LFGGMETWTSLGKAMTSMGIDAAPAFWGFMAGLAEFGGGILLMLGFLFRPACILLFVTMLVATVKHLTGGDSLMVASHAIEAGILFLSLIFIGPGKWSVDRG